MSAVHATPATVPAAGVTAPRGAARALAPATPVALAAIAVGIAADLLLVPAQPALGAATLALVLIAAVAALGARAHRLSTEARALLVVAGLFAAALVWRASPALVLLNLLALAATLAVLAAVLAAGGRWSVRRAHFRDYAAAVFGAAVAGGTGAPAVARAALGESAAVRTRGRRDALVVARAVAVTVPPFLLFAALLTAADPVFARVFGAAVDVEIGAALRHIGFVAAFAWPAAGYLHAAAVAPGRARHGLAGVPVRLGVAEVAAALGAIDLLFLAFVAVQVRYLFDGTGTLGVAGLTYAEYARRGFFELVAVTALVLPVLLVTRGLLGRTTRRAERVYRALAGAMLVLVLMIVASAMYRMRMYQAQYGLTELRLYTSVFMGWIVGVLGLFAITVLQGRRRGLAFGALSSALAIVAGLNVVNPDAVIVRVNGARLTEGRTFDAAYAAGLSADAAPALAALYPRLDADGRCRAASALSRAARERPTDWRAWNAGLARGAAAGGAAEYRATTERCAAAARAEGARLAAIRRHPTLLPPVDACALRGEPAGGCTTVTTPDGTAAVVP